jgi:SAM-dependent methyltransferase
MIYDEAALQEVRESRLLLNGLDTWLFNLINPYAGQRVLEVGCGLGNMIPNLEDRELVIGIDIAANAVDHINAVYRDRPNIRAIKYDIADPAVLELKSQHFDTAISINVFEHVENDLLALQQTYELLAPAGRLILIVPAHMLLYGTMDRSIGHYRRYTQTDLSEKLQRAGFHVEIIKYLNPLGALGWFINGRVLRRKVPPRGQLKFFNLLMPFVISFESKIRSPFGLSLFSISVRSS